MLKISFLYRKKNESKNSIEELFYTISAQLSKACTVSNMSLAFQGASPFILFKNLVSFKKENEIIHITGDVHYMAIVTGKKTVLTIHDVQSILKGNILKRIYLSFFWFWLPSLFVSKITVISEFSKMELLKIIPWAKKKVIVVHNPVNTKILEQSNFVVDTPNPISGIFKILLLGTKDNKNLFRSIEALSVLPCELIIIGKLSEKQKLALAKYKMVYQNPVNISFEEVIFWYKQCDIVSFASTYEGFGMPIIEAQALGKPVVTSDVASMPEIALDSAIMIDPYSVESIRKGISLLMFDEKLRKDKIIQGYQNIERFKIDSICNQYLAIYKEIESC